ncbi:hypothetical protein CVT25_001552 [Psilocybe cyanescens]|uniref:Uncharacterized protein n=1 Tax=Psilocybe cyanescens TaxID=93625 RepID=A0A409WPU5_PSICY|nr:hypothetical protein CVT25_001552 [Psilocybe cyanescens]
MYPYYVYLTPPFDLERTFGWSLEKGRFLLYIVASGCLMALRQIAVTLVRPSPNLLITFGPISVEAALQLVQRQSNMIHHPLLGVISFGPSNRYHCIAHVEYGTGNILGLRSAWRATDFLALLFRRVEDRLTRRFLHHSVGFIVMAGVLTGALAFMPKSRYLIAWKEGTALTSVVSFLCGLETNVPEHDY